jgi:TonB-dependent receptor
VELIEEGATYEGQVLGRDTTFITPVDFDKSDTQYLPSLNLRFEAREDVVLRAAAYASLFRPNMQDIAPRFAIEQNDDDDREGEFGNPDLDPYSAWNFDASGEWYFADNAVLQGGVFHKRIEDFIFRQVLEDVDFNGLFVDEGVIPLNGDTAEVTGLELNYQHALSDLPAPFDGLILGANYTYVDSEADIGDRSTELPGTSENVMNLILGYEAGPVSLRLAWVYRDEYLDELSGDGESDRFVQDHESLDFGARYTVSDSIQLFFEAANILDEPYVAVARTPLGDRLLQYEEYSFTLNAGLKATF